MNNFKKITLALALVAVIISLTNIVEARINNPLSSAPFFTGTSSTATTTLAGGLAVETNGLVYDYSSNNVGIGTSASQFKLAVAGFASASLADVIYIRNTDSTVNSSAGIAFGITPGDTPGGISARIYAKRVNTPTNGDTELYFENRRNSVNTTSMMIDTVGDIGIGTTSPFARLSVNGSAGGTSSLFAVASSTSGFATSTAFEITSQGQIQIKNAIPYYGTGGSTSIVCYMSDGSLGHITITSLLASGNCVKN